MDLRTRINNAQHLNGPAYWQEMEEIRRQMRQIQPPPVRACRTVTARIKPKPIGEQVAAFLASDKAAALSGRDRAYLEKLAKIST